MTEQPTREQLLHLLNRAIDGVALHGEGEHLRRLVLDLEQRADEAAADRDRVQQAACRTAESLRHTEAANARAALDQPQQPTEDEARQLPCSLWLLSNGHAPHWWQPQPGMADVLCPGAPRKAVATQPQQPTTTEA